MRLPSNPPSTVLTDKKAMANLVLLLLACTTVACSDVKNTQNSLKITANDFPTPLTIDFVRSIDSNLSNDLFQKKWQSSHSSPMMLMRAFPDVYHADLKHIARNQIPGPEVLCLGDAHPDNFGFLKLDKKGQYTFNDLDDSGYCPMAVDALRYFTTLSLDFDDQVLTSKLIDTYINVLTDPSKAVAINVSLVPDWAQKDEKSINKEVQGNALVRDNVTVNPSDLEAQAIRSSIAGNTYLGAMQLSDIVTVDRDNGGSGGLRRFRILLKDHKGTQHIIELKEAAIPGTNFGMQTKVLSMDERLEILKETFWQTNTKEEYFYLSMLGSRFLVRDRLHMSSLDLKKLSKEDRENALSAEVSVMALIHQRTLAKGTGIDDLKNWITTTTPVITQRWADLYNLKQ